MNGIPGQSMKPIPPPPAPDPGADRQLVTEIVACAELRYLHDPVHHALVHTTVQVMSAGGTPYEHLVHATASTALELAGRSLLTCHPRQEYVLARDWETYQRWVADRGYSQHSPDLPPQITRVNLHGARDVKVHLVGEWWLRPDIDQVMSELDIVGWVKA